MASELHQLRKCNGARGEGGRGEGGRGEGGRKCLSG